MSNQEKSNYYEIILSAEEWEAIAANLADTVNHRVIDLVLSRARSGLIDQINAATNRYSRR